ncbi:VanZ family protein [Streptacidiphilus monticola]
MVQVVAGAAALLVLVACLAAVVKLTLTPSPASVGIAHTNLRPGATIRLYLQQPSVRQALLQIGGNVLVGVPFGLALPVFAPRFRGVMRVLAATLVVVGALEVAQHFFVPGRSFDVDDIILALVGALAGYLLAGRRLSRLVHPRHRHAWQRYGDRLRRRRAQQT